MPLWFGLSMPAAAGKGKKFTSVRAGGGRQLKGWGTKKWAKGCPPTAEAIADMLEEASLGAAFGPDCHGEGYGNTENRSAVRAPVSVRKG